MTSNEHVDGLDGKQDIKYFLALTEITAGCSAPISHREMPTLGQAGGPRSIVFPHLIWQRRNKTCLKRKSGVGQMLFSPRPASSSWLVYGSDFSEVPAVTSGSSCRPRRACRGEPAEGAVGTGSSPAAAAAFSRDLGLADPSPCAGLPSCEEPRAE